MTERRILLDTNLLILLVAGSTSLARIARHKRLSDFVEGDFHQLISVLSKADKLVVTPNILTETSNLIGSPKNPSDAALFMTLANLVQNSDLEEIYVPSIDVMQMPQFNYLGLTDAAVLALKEKKIVVLTRDARLVEACSRVGIDVLPFQLIGASG